VIVAVLENCKYIVYSSRSTEVCMKFSINTHQWFLRKMTRTLKLLEMDKTCSINFRKHLNMTEGAPVGRFQNGSQRHFRFTFWSWDPRTFRFSDIICLAMVAYLSRNLPCSTEYHYSWDVRKESRQFNVTRESTSSPKVLCT